MNTKHIILIFLTSTACAQEPKPQESKAAYTYCNGFLEGYRQGFCAGHPGWVKCPEVAPKCVEKNETYNVGLEDGYSQGAKEHHCGHPPCGDMK